MVRPASEKAIDVLVAELVKHNEARSLAMRRRDSSAANRHFDRGTPILMELASRTPDGRAALETLLEHHSASMRVSAAATVLKWNPGRAIPVLAAIVNEDLNPEYSPGERIDARIGAKGLLYRHFGITSFDPDDLVEPLKALGVTWPTEKERQEADRRRRAY